MEVMQTMGYWVQGQCYLLPSCSLSSQNSITYRPLYTCIQHVYIVTSLPVSNQLQTMYTYKLYNVTSPIYWRQTMCTQYTEYSVASIPASLIQYQLQTISVIMQYMSPPFQYYLYVQLQTMCTNYNVKSQFLYIYIFYTKFCRPYSMCTNVT